jgi:hypothetical protein
VEPDVPLISADFKGVRAELYRQGRLVALTDRESADIGNTRSDIERIASE